MMLSCMVDAAVVLNNTSKLSVLNYYNRWYNSHTVPIASDTTSVCFYVLLQSAVCNYI